jgi:hypothetical protein
MAASTIAVRRVVFWFVEGDRTIRPGLSQSMSPVRPRAHPGGWTGDEDGNPGSPLVNAWSLGVAADELLKALVDFQRHELPAPAIFPTAEEVTEWTWAEDGSEGGHSIGLDEINTLVRKRQDAKRSP